MSLLGFDSAGSATINGLTEINANNVFSDVLYYDAGTFPVNVKTAIDGITIDVTALEADVLTLQGEMNAVEADVATLQGEMNDVEADVATLQSDVTALTISTGITAATVAGLVVSQAAQDVTIASHTVSIAALQLEDLSLDTRIDALEVKTTDQSWGSLTGTSFSTKVNVGGGSGVVLNTASASVFNSGITTDLIQSVTNNNLILEGRGTGDAILKAGGTNRITCADTGEINVVGTGVTTLQGTGIAINATTAGVQTFATSSTLIQSTTTTTLTSGGETEINCVGLDVNAGGGPVTVDTTGNFTVNAAINSITGTTNTVLGTTNINVTGTSATSIGNTNGALAFKGDDVTIDSSDIFLKTTGATNGVISLESSENISLVSVNDDVYINEGTSSVMNTKIGNATGTISLTGSLNTVLGTTNINSTGVANTNIGNMTGVTTVTGQATFLGNTQLGDASADAIVPNGTLTKPFIIGTYSAQSSYSTTSTTPLTTYLGGTLESVKTFTNSATGNFRYIMASVSPFNANGGITLSGGTYMFWLAINFEDGSTFNLTDLTMGLSTVSTLTSASSEATIIASLPNLTCFFHKTDAGDAAVSDSEQRVLSSCFNLASSTTVYPFYFANHSVTIDSVQCNTVFVKIGSA